jgi:predicted transcriptional regulator
VTEALMLVLPAQGPRSGAERVVGAACRICPRAGCVARREPSIVGAGD